jgi:hypothetical protein
LFRNLGHRLGQAQALNDLGVVQRETGHYRGCGCQPPAGPSSSSVVTCVM